MTKKPTIKLAIEDAKAVCDIARQSIVKRLGVPKSILITPREPKGTTTVDDWIKP
jgi:hypothetical protein